MPSAEAFIELNKCSLFVQNSAFIGGEWVKATIPRDHVLGTRYRGHDAQGASRIAPTLVAGCAVVVKPPSETPCMALSLTKLAIEAGFPRKVIQLVARKDQGVASELEVNPEGTAKKVSLVFGGYVPIAVLEDSDLDLLLRGAMFSKFHCLGQTCVCANRLYVQSVVVEEFSRRFVKEVEELKAVVQKAEEHILDAVSKGAEMRSGGTVDMHAYMRCVQGTAPKGLGNGFFTRPTVLTGATVDMAVAKDATFGPLVPIFASESEEEVARLANNTEFGLAGYLYSKDIGLMMRTAQKMQVGIYGVDTGKVAAAESPFGGTKESDYRLTIGLKGASTALLSTKPSRLLPLGT
ncbi:succinate semialdehyde dehydrogenase [Penicillium chrysogenum]|uniref:Succinate semialdehyde dehydrogenase n=1 Tax=Penicillium chrysogenum TaxID=5076 RepID=A0ABQ8WFA3_PENCH|nr:succinate semialdehyde dehydrogenase [Penicillium chrysogenum]